LATLAPAASKSWTAETSLGDSSSCFSEKTKSWSILACSDETMMNPLIPVEDAAILTQEARLQ